MDFMDILNTTGYRTTMEYPRKPVEPNILRMRVSDVLAKNLSLDDIASAKAEYDREMAEYPAKLAAYRDDVARMEKLFWEDLFGYYGIDAEHPLAGWLRSKSWETGHSSGFSEVAAHFADLVEVIDIIDNHYIPIIPVKNMKKLTGITRHNHPDYAKFFSKLEVGEIFEYWSSFMFSDVKSLAEKHNVVVESVPCSQVGGKFACRVVSIS